MADSKITALTAISTVDPTADPLVIVDVSDTSMAASGTTKKSTINQLLGAGGTATLASATITGDLTVDTSTLKVDSANNRVGIGTASPAATVSALIGSEFLHFGFGANNDNYYTVGASGTHFWRSSSTEQMRLNSTGLGVGVVPSAWDSTFKAIQINNRGAYISATSNSFSTAPFVQIGNNGYYDATNSRWEYVTANAAAQYIQAANSHLWYTAAVGSADAEITDFATAKMTLDASGRLILLASTTTPATLATNGQLTFTATTNTNLRFSYRGSDGVTRTADLTLA